MLAHDLRDRPREVDAREDLVAETGVPFDERDMLIEAEPETFHTTDHFRNYSYVLVRLANAHPGTVERLLLRPWRATAPKKVLKAWDEAHGTETP